MRITADAANNSLLIYSNQENYRIIEQTLYQLDRPQLQVSIDATIAEITLNDSLKYGVQYFIQSKDVGLKPDSGSVDLVNSATSAVLSRALPGFNFLLGSEANPRIILDALRAVSDVKVLSAPSVVVLDNQVATLQVGDQIPVTTQSATSVIAPGAPIVNNIDYRNTGVILRVVPRINVNGNVLLDIEQEISNVAANATANTLTPTVSQRKVKSSIAVATGQTVLLAGLISERQERDRSGIPCSNSSTGWATLSRIRTTRRSEPNSSSSSVRRSSATASTRAAWRRSCARSCADRWRVRGLRSSNCPTRGRLPSCNEPALASSVRRCGESNDTDFGQPRHRRDMDRAGAHFCRCSLQRRAGARSSRPARRRARAPDGCDCGR